MQKSDFSKIIGYDKVKEELSIIGDMFSNPDKYKQIGAEIPKGILLSGEPGIGKTTFAYSFMEASGVNTYVIRRSKDTAAFLEEINSVFEEAKQNAPSIVLLDDMDKFVKDKEGFEEFTAVQACIDSVANSTVLVIATVNEIGIIPPSLSRSGRFDRIINMSVGISDMQSGNHWKYFLKNDDVTIDVDDEDINKLFYMESPSSMKAIINDALINAAYANESSISRDGLIKAFLRKQQKEYTSTETMDEKELAKTAYHEAGHVVVMETLNPGSVGLATAVGAVIQNPGFVKMCKSEKEPEQILHISLAGKLSEERYLKRTSLGASMDLKIYQMHLDVLFNEGYYGMEYIGEEDPDERLKEDIRRKKMEVSQKVSQEVSDILDKNWNLVELIAKELISKNTLLGSDIKRLMEAA